ncbi:MAG TPA: helix-turn-helix transcriptional regulator, partial [Symbiobacteriaceae bacterium]|nr:helix-turn-helix transcriptional regulator [Symbiobacteriaceae bacterium]
MTDSLLMTTKLYLPAPRAGQISRERLTARLAEGACLPLTLIAAPAGFGKSTLAAEWAQRQGLRPAWVSLDEGDNDPVRFWTYVATALHRADGRLGAGALALLRSPQPPAVQAVVAALVSEAASITGRVALVLDDYHLITARPVHDGMIA